MALQSFRRQAPSWFRRPVVFDSFWLLLFVAMTGHAFAETDTKAKKAPIHPALVQVDEDPKLPRVLLIGDSITMGYTQPLRELLAKKANVQHPAENCGPSRRIVEHLDHLFGEKAVGRHSTQLRHP